MKSGTYDEIKQKKTKLYVVIQFDLEGNKIFFFSYFYEFGIKNNQN